MNLLSGLDIHGTIKELSAFLPTKSRLSKKKHPSGWINFTFHLRNVGSFGGWIPLMTHKSPCKGWGHWQPPSFVQRSRFTNRDLLNINLTEDEPPFGMMSAAITVDQPPPPARSSSCATLMRTLWRIISGWTVGNYEGAAGVPRHWGLQRVQKVSLKKGNWKDKAKNISM